ncbi:MAG TPA: Lrp/AsnC ligand binding domain-containing protein [Caulobacteraceae bacterium]|nr:Lrp/AsnC ligand binding domain-containing protein [Caulobacteraceae bacterium]
MIIDDTDRRILRTLQREGRITNLELAQRAHLSPAACHERTRRLRDAGVITGYSARIDPHLVGLPLLVFVEVLLDRTTKDAFEAFATAIRHAPEVLECHMVAGGFDYLVKARMRDMDAYRAFLGNTLVDIPGVRETRTYAVLEEVKNSSDLPI